MWSRALRCLVVIGLALAWGSVVASAAAGVGTRRVWLPLSMSGSAWYKVRLDVTTTSDWSEVELAGGARVRASGVVAADGGTLTKKAGGVCLNQSAAAALSGRRASASVEFALTDLGPSLSWVIKRGDWGYTDVTVWNANGAQPVKLGEVHWAGQNPPDNAHTLTVSAQDVAREGPLTRGWGELQAAEFALERRLDAALPQLSPEFHRARIVFTTTSDWANLYLLGGVTACDAQLAGTSGEPTGAEASAAGLSLQQPLERAYAGARVGLTAELLLCDLAQDEVQLLITKGGLGEATVELYNANGPAPVLVRRVTHAGSSVPGDPHNPYDFTVASGLLTAQGPLPLRKPATTRMIWAFYYLWYNNGSWRDPILQDRPSAPYASSDAAALARHIDQAKGAGIDGFVASWWGPGNENDANWGKLLDQAAQRGFWVMPYLETLDWDSQPRSEAELTAWLDYLLRTYRSRPAWYRLDGRPVVAVWASSTVPTATWQRIFATLRGRGLDAAYLAMGLRDTSVLSVFDGLHEYGVFTIFRLGQTYQAVDQAVRAYSLLHYTEAPKVYVATLQPGYDERTIPGRSGLYWERRDGEAYRYTFEAATKSDPDWLFITSWNEWWEHTYIEPSMRYGDLYLRLTREFAEEWK